MMLHFINVMSILLLPLVAFLKMCVDVFQFVYVTCMPREFYV